MATDQPDSMTRYDRWEAFWDVWSRTLPPDIEDWQYTEATGAAFDAFEKQDAATQAENLARAWGIIKTLPKRRQRKSPTKAIVVPPPPRWEPCEYWQGKVCTKHKHTMQDTSYKQAQSLFEIHSKFVRRRILVELMPWGGKKYDALEVEGVVWWTVATRMAEYVPQLKNYLDPDKVGQHWKTESPEPEQAKAQMWLRKIVKTVVLDVVRGQHAGKRDINREVPIPAYAGDRGIPNHEGDGVFGLPAKPTPTADMQNLMAKNGA
jgi:hypothetical protein